MKNKKTKDLAIFALFVFPAVAFVLFATDIPFVMNLYYSVFNWNGIGKNMEFVGLANYVKIFTADPLFWKGVRFTLKFAVFYVVIVNIVSLTVAIVMARENKVNSLGRAFYYIPYIISLTAISLIWKFILGPGFEALYSVTGWEFFNWSWLGTPKLAFYVVVVMAVWQNLGFYMVNYIAGIIAVPGELLEAARIDGATSFQVFRKITIPMIMPAISICMLTSMTFAFKLFDIIMVFTKGGPANSTVSVAYNIYKEAFVNSKYGLATAKSLVFVVFVLIIMPMMVPFQSYMITLTRLVSNVKLTGTRTGYILVSVGLCMPLAVYMIHGFVKNVPIDLEECACIDGAGKIRTYFSIVLPLLKPILTTVVVLDALATWNDIITNQLIVGGNTVAMNIQNALYMQFSAQTADWEHALPGIVMSMIPSLIFFVVMQKHIVGGITAGAVKG